VHTEDLSWIRALGVQPHGGAIAYDLWDRFERGEL